MDESKEVALQDLTEYYENKLQEKSSQLEQVKLQIMTIFLIFYLNYIKLDNYDVCYIV